MSEKRQGPPPAPPPFAAGDVVMLTGHNFSEIRTVVADDIVIDEKNDIYRRLVLESMREPKDRKRIESERLAPNDERCWTLGREWKDGEATVSVAFAGGKKR